jgi:Lon protease-like protein
METCRAFLDRLQEGTAPWVVQRMASAYGVMPTDPSAFSFWVALVLPIDEHEKAKLLPLRSVRLRLLLLAHWIEQLNSQWYAFVWRVVACLAWTVLVLTVSRFVGFI